MILLLIIIIIIIIIFLPSNTIYLIINQTKQRKC